MFDKTGCTTPICFPGRKSIKEVQSVPFNSFYIRYTGYIERWRYIVYLTIVHCRIFLQINMQSCKILLILLLLLINTSTKYRGAYGASIMGGKFSFCVKCKTVDSRRSIDENVKAMELKVDALYMKMQLLKIKTLLRDVRRHQKMKSRHYFRLSRRDGKL